MGVFSLANGKVVTKQAIGTNTLPMWEGAEAVKKGRWIDMETLEVVRTRDF